MYCCRQNHKRSKEIKIVRYFTIMFNIAIAIGVRGNGFVLMLLSTTIRLRYPSRRLLAVAAIYNVWLMCWCAHDSIACCLVVYLLSLTYHTPMRLSFRTFLVPSEGCYMYGSTHIISYHRAGSEREQRTWLNSKVTSIGHSSLLRSLLI